MCVTVTEAKLPQGGGGVEAFDAGDSSCAEARIHNRHAEETSRPAGNSPQGIEQANWRAAVPGKIHPQRIAHLSTNLKGWFRRSADLHSRNLIPSNDKSNARDRIT